MDSFETAQEAMLRRGKIAEDLIALERPELIDLFLTYQNEAIEARKFLNESLVKLNKEADILEVGGGILALSVQLASEGFQITAVEPVGEGFTGISYIMEIFLEISRNENLRIQLIRHPIEACEFKGEFDFIFSINVLEHLKNPYLVMIQLVGILKEDGSCRIFCPNYDFPYEPHFQKWMYQRKNGAFYLPLSKAKTSMIEISEWEGVHRSLNFTTLRKLERFLLQNKIRYLVNKSALQNILMRGAFDQELKNRHKLLASGIDLLFKLRLIRVTGLLPQRFWPIIDIEIFN
jgi:2-polyprenyl-3-methyl-5-hydroxy-6-metoxy-1,4-benzoquinol methylase